MALFFLLVGPLFYLKTIANTQADSTHISMHLNNASIEKAFTLIKQQTAYRVIYDNSVLKKAKPVTIAVQNELLSAVLKLIFQNQPFDYSIIDESIIVVPRMKNEAGTITASGKSQHVATDTLITGTVLADSALVPLAGATIAVKGANSYTTTDLTGRFQLTIPGTATTITISYVGYLSKNILIDKNKLGQLRILLTKMPQEMREVTIVNTGYESLPRERATGSFTQIDNKLYNQQTGTNVLDRLESITNGLVVDRTSNSPGIMIRGLSTIIGVKGPLIILDNFPYEGDINNINPNDVESITVLKDAAAASIWGTKAGNGVIVISTKKGKFNQPLTIEFNSNVTVTGKPDLNYIKQMSSADFIGVEKFLFAQGFYDAALNDPSYPVVSPVVELLNQQRSGQINPAQADEQIAVYQNHDVRSDFKKYLYQQAVNQQYAINMRGGTGNFSWISSVGFDKNANELDATYNRLNLRLENTYRPVRGLQLTTGLYYTQSKTGSGRPGYYDLITSNGQIPPYTALADANGKPLAIIKDYRQAYLDTVGGGKLLDWNYYPLEDYKHAVTTNTTQDILGTLGINYKLTGAIGFDIKYQYEKQQVSGRTLYDQQSYFARNQINLFSQIDPGSGQVNYIVPLGSILDLSNASLESHDVRGEVNLNKTWSKHSIVAIAGSELRQVDTKSYSFRTYGYDDDILTSVNVDYANFYPTFITGNYSLIPNNNGFGENLNRFVSTYANAAYTFDNKYSVSASARRDASNLFGVNTNNKWTPLWSAGAGWDIYKESFYHLNTMPYLRLRATYGFSGNVDQSKAAVTTISYLGSSPYTGTPTANFYSYGNPDLRWEKVGMLNIGVDFKMKNNRIGGSLEYYHKKGFDLYGTAPQDYTAGIGSTVTKNVASMKADGIDIELNSLNINGAFKWVTNLNLNYNKDEVVNYYLGDVPASNFISSTQPNVSGLAGKPVYSLFSYRWAGLDPLTGDPQGILAKQTSKDYATITGSGTQLADLVYSGSAMPVLFGSMGNTFSWNGFSLTARLLYKFGYYFRKSSIDYTNLFNTRTGHSDFAKRWQNPGDEKATNVPSMIYPSNSARDAFYNGSTVTVDKGDNIRIQYITLSYEITRKKNNSFPFKSLQLYSSMNNIGIIWRANKDHIDPDYPSASLPPSKSIVFGLRGNF